MTAVAASVRAADERDRGAVRALIRAGYAEFAGAVGPVHHATMATNLDRVVRSAGPERLMVAERDDEIVGTVTYLAPGHPDYDHVPQTWAVIRALAVHPDRRGRGVARALTDACLERAMVDRAVAVGLHTAELMTAARTLYEGLGFVRDRTFGHLGVTFLVYRLDL